MGNGHHSLPARHILSALIMLALLAGCGKTPRLPPLAHDATLLAFGDSLTFGTGADPRDSYPARLALATGRTVVNAGVPGETTAEGLARLPRVLEETKPDLVILCLGGNDFLRKHDSAQTSANLERMINMIRSEGIPVVLIGVPQMRLFSDSDPLYQDLARKHRLPIEDDILADVLHKNSLKSDPIHPNAEGYRRIAEAVAALLKESGAL
jgi:lysophospholipase L1-like esterase